MEGEGLLYGNGELHGEGVLQNIWEGREYCKLLWLVKDLCLI